MSDASNGSAMLAGNPAGQPPAGDNGGAGAASTPPAGDNGGGSPPPDAGNWYDKIEDGDLKGYAQTKGWKDPADLANSYRNLEKLVGSEKVPLPKGADDKDGWNRVYDALGRPKSAEEYKLPVPDGDPGTFAKAASGKFHELGISQQQAEGLANWWNETQQGQMAQQQQQSAQKVEADISALRGEWGQAWDENINLGSRAAKEFGLDQNKLTAIENALGTGEMLKFMARIGRGLTEHNFEGGNSTQSFGMTPEAARSRISALQADPAWASKYIGGGADQQAEMRKLMAIAYPEQN